jgi:hypothetical protein
MTLENEPNKHENSESELHEIANGVRNILRKVNEISEQVEDNCHALCDINDAATGENGNGWYDLYDDDNGL